jgi:hypothetical protein
MCWNVMLFSVVSSCYVNVTFLTGENRANVNAPNINSAATLLANIRTSSQSFCNIPVEADEKGFTFSLRKAMNGTPRGFTLENQETWVMRNSGNQRHILA